MRTRFTPVARSEFNEIVQSVRRQSPKGAVSVSRRIREIVRFLGDQPRADRATNVAGLYRHPVTPYPYVVFYEIEAGVVQIVGIRHTSRDPASMPDAR